MESLILDNKPKDHLREVRIPRNIDYLYVRDGHSVKKYVNLRVTIVRKRPYRLSSRQTRALGRILARDETFNLMNPTSRRFYRQ